MFLMSLNGASFCQAQFSVIYTFPNASAGFSPFGKPYIGPGGVVYGTTLFGGTNLTCFESIEGCGTVFSLTPPAQCGKPWTENVLYSFQGAPDGSEPFAGVLPGKNGTLLGTTEQGGPQNPHCFKHGGAGLYGCGTLFQLTPAQTPGGEWTEEVLYAFTKPDAAPGALSPGKNGVLFGVPLKYAGDQACTTGCGVAFELFPPAGSDTNWSLSSIHQFSMQSGDFPFSPLVVAPNGVLYGTTETGGVIDARFCPNGCGTVFSLTPPVPPATSWTYQDIYQFQGPSDGNFPVTGLVAGPDGTLYGTTSRGGSIDAPECAPLGCGTVFSLSFQRSFGLWVKTILYSFQGSTDGDYVNDLAMGAGGVLYGTTIEGGGDINCGGGYGCGTVFQLMPPAAAGGNWTENTLYVFTAAGQASGLATDPNGVLYGFATGGTGTNCFDVGCGFVYQYIP